MEVSEEDKVMTAIRTAAKRQAKLLSNAGPSLKRPPTPEFVPPGRRKATAVAEEACQVLCIPRASFAAALRELRLGGVRERMGFLDMVSVLRGWPKEKLCELAQQLHPRHYARGEVLIQQGTSPDSLFFIQQGHCRVVCDVAIQSRGTVPIEVHMLWPTDFAGEDGLIHRLQSCYAPASVVAETSCDVLVLSKANFNTLLASERTMLMMHQKAEQRHFTQESLEARYWQRGAWKAYKAELFNEITRTRHRTSGEKLTRGLFGQPDWCRPTGGDWGSQPLNMVTANGIET